MWKVHLCKECIKDLDEYYPYTVPRNELNITEVPQDECDNHNLDDYNERLQKRNAKEDAI